MPSQPLAAAPIDRRDRPGVWARRGWLCEEKFLSSLIATIYVQNSGDIYHAEAREKARAVFQSFLETGGVRDADLLLKRKDGGKLQVTLNATAVRDESGWVRYSRSILRDVSARNKAAAEIERQLSEITSYYDNAPIGLAVLDRDLRFVRINRMLAAINGLSAAEHVGKTVNDVVPSMTEQAQTVISRIMATGKPVAGIEFTGETAARPGSVRTWLEGWYPVRDENGDIFCFSVIAQDITERKNSEAEIKIITSQLRLLTSHLQETIEKERKHIAREIHDDLGQTLSALKLDIGWIKKRIHPDQNPVLEKLGNMVSVINQSAQSVRRICRDLRPGILDDLGLAYTLQWHAERFQENTGILCQLEMDTGDCKIEKGVATAVYRIFQESLTNVSRHAKATRVQASLACKNNRLSLVIHDNGKGIRHSAISAVKSFGIIGIRERVHALGGEFEISGGPGEGTRINLSIPLTVGIAVTQGRKIGGHDYD